MSAELPFVEAFVAVLAETTVKGTLILALAGLVTALGMRRAAAATRHLVWSGAVACVLMLPLLRTVAPRWALASLSVPALSLPVLRDVAVTVEAGNAADNRGARMRSHAASPAGTTPLVQRPVVHGDVAPRVAPANVVETSSAPVAPDRDGFATAHLTAPVAPASTVDHPLDAAIAKARRALGLPTTTLLLLLWAAGALLVLARLVVGTVALARLSRRSKPCDDPRFTTLLQSLRLELGVRRPVTLLVGGADAVPMTWGVVYPKVLLPPDAASWSDGRRRAVLLHELAHIERFDTLTHLMSQVAVAVLWFHPLAIIASRRLRAERERACDDLVLAAGGVRATAYADDLLQFVSTMRGSRALGAGLAMARRSEFEGRLLSILDPNAPRARTSKRRTLAATLLVAVASLPLAGLRSAAEAATVRGKAGPATTAAVSLESAAAMREASATADASSSASTAPASPLGRAVSTSVVPTPEVPDAEAAALPMLPGVVVSTSVGEYDGGLTKAARARLARDLAEMERARQRLERGAPVAPGARGGAPGSDTTRAPRAASQEALPSAVIADFARAVSGMSSDGDKAAVLLKLAPRVGDSGEIRSAFFGAMRAMTSDGEQRRVLDGVVRRTEDDSTLAAVLDAARRMTSDTQRAAVLMTVVERRRLSAAFVRDRFFLAVDGMTSESMREHVLLALVRADPRNEALHLPVINAAAKITSERQQGNVLLAIANSTPALRSTETRARFLDALSKLTSSTEYRRVMDAMVR